MSETKTLTKFIGLAKFKIKELLAWKRCINWHRSGNTAS